MKLNTNNVIKFIPSPNLILILGIILAVIYIAHRLRIFNLAGSLFTGANLVGISDDELRNTIDRVRELQVKLAEETVRKRITGRKETYFNMLSKWKQDIISKSNKLSSNKFIIASMIIQESSGNPELVGLAGEIGLMQITEAALSDVNRISNTKYNFNELFIGSINIEVGIRFFELQFKRMNNDTFEALRAFNAGETGARNNKNLSKLYAETVLERAVFIKENGLI